MGLNILIVAMILSALSIANAQFRVTGAACDMYECCQPAGNVTFCYDGVTCFNMIVEFYKNYRCTNITWIVLTPLF